MKLWMLAEDYQQVSPNWYLGYHVTDSFHMVKKIFKEGFRTFEEITTCGKVCFSDRPWADMGLYIIRLAAHIEDPSIMKASPGRPWRAIYGGDPEGKGESRLVSAEPEPLTQPARAWKHRFPGRRIRFGAQGETKVDPSVVKPVAWGLIFSIDDIVWIKESPEKFDFDKYNDIVMAHATENWQLEAWHRDMNVEDVSVHSRDYSPSEEPAEPYRQKPINI